MNDLERRIRKTTIKTGFLLGVILVALNIFSFYLITSITKSPLMVVIGPKAFSLLIPIIIAMLLCFYVRKKVGGYWTFKQATTGIFIMFFLAYLVKLAGNDLIFDRYIESNNVQKTMSSLVNAKITIMKQRGYGQKNIDLAVADLKKDFVVQKNITVWSIFFSIAISILFLFLFALIFAALLRNAEYVPVSQINQ